MILQVLITGHAITPTDAPNQLDRLWEQAGCGAEYNGTAPNE